MPKIPAAVYAGLMAIDALLLVAAWQRGMTTEIALAAAAIGFIVGMATALWMLYTIRG